VKALPERHPNIVIIFTDDQGYNDVGCFGAAGFQTPLMDLLAAEGVKFTNFYVAQPVCSASRAALLTGCYPNRLGIHGAFSHTSITGLNPAETTIAEMLKPLGYATGLVGKWHLGYQPEFLPTRQGFDEFFGLPYSNDMWPHHPTQKDHYPPLPLYEQETGVDTLWEDQSQLTRQYTTRAVEFIEKHHERPFFLYLAHSMPHVPLFVSEAFAGQSEKGLYGDVMMELDWSVGEVMAALKKYGIDEQTLVIFTSDNGPWISYGGHAGSAAPLKEGKGTVWEGGVRVPCIMRWPGVLPAGAEQTAPAMTIDILPTLARLVSAPLPALPIDGKEIWPLVTVQPGATSPQQAYYFYYRQNELHAVLSGKWKLYLPHRYQTLQSGIALRNDGYPVPYEMTDLAELALFDLEKDREEMHDVASAHPEVVERLLGYAALAREDMGDQLVQLKGPGNREPGRLTAP
jgi:arylsulfatase